MSSKQSGFTLIELVVVIVIIGILAAAALPRFVDLTGEAKQSAAQGVAGSISGGAALVKGKWLAEGASGSSVTLEDSTQVNVDSTTGFPKRTESDLKAILQQNPAQSGTWQWDISGATTSAVLITSDKNWGVDYSQSSGVAEVVSNP